MNPVLNPRYDICQEDDILITCKITVICRTDNTRIPSAQSFFSFWNKDLYFWRDSLAHRLFSLSQHSEIYSIQLFYSDYTNRYHVYKGSYPSYSCECDLIESFLDLFEIFIKDLRRYKAHGISG